MKTGIVRIGYAPITFGTGTVTFGTPVYLADAQAGAREYSAEPKGDLHTVWANSALVYAGNANSGYDIDVTLIDIIDDIAKSWYGDVSASMGNTAGIAEEGKAVSRPHFALILSEETTNGTGKTTVYYNCCAGKKPSLNGKTKEDGDWDDQFVEYSLISAPLENPSDNKKWVKIELPGTSELAAVSFPTVST